MDAASLRWEKKSIAGGLSSFVNFKHQLNLSFSTGVSFTEVTDCFVYIKCDLITKKNNSPIDA